MNLTLCIYRPTFKPTINPISEEIDFRKQLENISPNGGDTSYALSPSDFQPRWERLYSLQEERKMNEEIRKQELEEQQMKQQEE